MNWKELSVNRKYLYGIAIVWIMLFHFLFECTNFFEQQWLATIVLTNGNIGVDLFLFLSGVSLYFSMAKEKDTLVFYKKRMLKIGTVYLFCCIPFYIVFWTLCNNPKMAIKETLFLNLETNHFWYIICIAVCYLIYPAINYLITTNKKIFLYFFLICYIIGLFVLIYINTDLYYDLNKLVTRIPIFILGAISGELVYKKSNISPNLILLMLVGLFLKRPMERVFFNSGELDAYCHGFDRLYNGVIAIGVIFLLCMVFPYITQLKIMNLIGFLGKYTLELYVLHIAFREILKEILGITFDNNHLLFTVLYFALPILSILVIEVIKNQRMLLRN